MMQDTVIVNALANMSQDQYMLLIFRIIFTVLIGLSAILASFIGLLKTAKYLWDLLMEHVRSSIKDSYCTPLQLTVAVTEIKKAVSDGFAAGEARFASTDDRIALLEKKIGSIPVCRLHSSDECRV